MGSLMRTSTLVGLIVAAGIGIGLFYAKYEVQKLEAEIARVNKAIAKERETIHVLKAEWSYLNQPGRLRDLTHRRLSLSPIGPAHIMQINQLPRRFDAAASADGPGPVVRPHAAGSAR